MIAASLLRVPARRMRALARGDDGALRDWIANESATRIAEARRDARVAAARLEKLGGRIVAIDDPEYPAGLRDLIDPPPFLCVAGSLPARAFRTGTAVVGTREADDEARSMAHGLGARAPEPVVSGLARGVDAAAHEGALAHGRRTVAYVGHGFGATYPPQHADLERRIVASGGAILSELLPNEPVSRWSLVRRDRLQAAHAGSVVLVSSDAAGGAMHTLASARKLGRPRFAFSPRSQTSDSGNLLAIEKGARSLPWELPAALGVLYGEEHIALPVEESS